MRVCHKSMAYPLVYNLWYSRRILQKYVSRHFVYKLYFFFFFPIPIVNKFVKGHSYP